MIVGIPQETFPGETRVALIPAGIPALTKAGIEVHVQAGAGATAGFPDSHYLDKGAKVVSRDEVFAADVILQVRAEHNPEQGKADFPKLRAGQIVIGLCDPLGQPKANQEFASSGATLFGLELLPRITPPKTWNILSSQATIAGYRAVLLAAQELPKIFPMLITAAGTLNAAKVFIIGAGVAGLQAIATARRLGPRYRPTTSVPRPRNRSPAWAARWSKCPWTLRPAKVRAAMPRPWTKPSTRNSRS